MGSFSPATRNAWLTALVGGTPYANSAVWARLHVGDPGSLGIANLATNSTRMTATYDVPVAGVSPNLTALVWTSVPASETYTHISLWSAAVDGVLLGIDQLPAPVPVTVGGTFTIAIGALVLAVV